MKQKLLYTFAGVVIGCIIGFVATNSINQRYGAATVSQAGATNTTATSDGDASNPNLAPVDEATLAAATRASGGDPNQPHAIANVQAVIQQARNEPANFEAQMAAGDLFAQIRRFEQAVEYYGHAHQAKPDAFDPLVRLGASNFELKRFEEAGRWFGTALERQPDNADVRADLGLSYFSRTPPDADRAIQEYRKVLEANPKHEATLQNLTAALIFKRDREEARAALARLEAVNPQSQAIPVFRTDIDKL